MSVVEAAVPRRHRRLTADHLWSKLIRSLSERCVACRIRPTTDAAHILGKKAHPGVRWSILNGQPLCRICHDHYTRNPKAWTAWVVERLGEERLAHLRALSRLPGPTVEEALETLAGIEVRLRARNSPAWMEAR